MNNQTFRTSSAWAVIQYWLRIALYLLPCFAFMAPFAGGQTNTTVNLGTQARNPDFSAMPVTKPVTVGVTLPSTCVVGQLFFNSSATAGNNLQACTATNTWTNLAVSIGSSLPASCSVGQLFFNSTANSGSNVYGCTSANTWTVMGGSTLPSPLPVSNGGTGTVSPALVAGTNVTISGTWPNQTVSASGAFTGNANAIQGTTVSTTTPGNNQGLVFNSTSSAYVPTTLYTLQNGLGTTTSGLSTLQVNVSLGVRAVTAVNDTISSTDCGGLVTYNNASAVAVAVPQPSLGGNFLSGCPITLRNYGAAALTITPSGSTIGGASTQAVSAGKGCLIVSDGTNWQLGNCN